MMKTNFFRRVFPLLALLVLGVTSAWGAEGDLYHTCSMSNYTSGTKVTDYTKSSSLVISKNTASVTWTCSGNQQSTQFRFGGKSINGVDRGVTSTTAMGAPIGKVSVEHAGTSSASLAVNSVTLTISSTADFSDIVYTNTINPTQNQKAITPSPIEWTGTWASGLYYKIMVNVTNTTGSNYYFGVNAIKFYEGVSSTDPTINASNVTLNADVTSGEFSYTISNPATDVNPTIKSTNGDWISNVAINTATKKVTFDASTNTGNTDRTATITISYTGAEDKVVTITQKKPVSYVTYNKVSASEMVIGGTYVWYSETSGGAKYVATSMGANTYFGSTALATESQKTETQIKLTTEDPQLFIFSQVSAAEWTIENGSSKYLYVSGDKQLSWAETKNVWVMSGTTMPVFACSSYNSTAYTMYGNSGSSRFCAYTAKNSMQDAVLYHLASESAHTLSCVIDGETTKTYNIKDGYTWTLLTPEKAGAVFLGWANTADGEVAYAGGADYTMGAANATLYAKWRVQTTAPVFTADLSASYDYMKGGAAVTLTIAATDADSYQWYKNSTNSTEGATAISGATAASYSYTGTTIGTEYLYCVATNAVGSTNSAIAVVTTKGSNLCVLSQLVYSNGFDAFLKNNTITAYYMEGTTAPTISSAKLSAGATYEVNGNTLTVTAEDGETSQNYTISLSAVTPTTTAANQATFDGNETWMKTGNAFDDTKGWVFSKNVEDATPRISEGRNRQYWFVGPATEFTLINTGVTSDRNIKVYVNSIEQTGITKIGKNSATDGSDAITIPGLSATGNNMIAIVSNQTGGDGGFTKYTFTPVPKYTINYYVNGTKVSSQENVLSGTALAFPNVSATGGKVFRGWKKGSAIDGVVNSFTDFAVTNNATASETTDYYAVFATAQEGAAGAGAKKTSLAAGDKIYLATAADGEGVTGWNNNKDATISSSVNEWIVFTVEANPSDASVLWLYSEDYEAYVRGYSGNFKIDGNNDNLNASSIELDATHNNIAKFLGSNYFFKRDYINSGTPTTNIRCYNPYPASAENNVYTPIFAFAVGTGTQYSDFCTTVNLTGSQNFVATDGVTKYATFSNNRAVEFGSDVTVYTVTVEDGAMYRHEVANKQVPANAGVLLACANASAEYTFIASANALENNMLHSASEEMTGDNKFYKLAYGDWTNKTDLGFYWGAEDGAKFDIKEGTAYLAVPTSILAPVRFVFNSTDQATGMENIEVVNVQKFFENGQVIILRDGVRYNALGQKIQ